jgi:uncharacterized membrane protein
MRSIIIIGISVVLSLAAIFSVDAGLYGGYLLFTVALGSALGLSIFNTLKSPGEFKKIGYAIVGVVVLFGVSYALSGSEVNTVQAAKGLTESTSKLVGAGLIMFYLISAVAVLGLVYSEINKALK